jgi:hypothetical protein
MLLNRGVEVDHTTVFRWIQVYAVEQEKRIRPHLCMSNGSWRVDETYVKGQGPLDVSVSSGRQPRPDLIPTALNTDTRSLPGSDGTDAVRVGDQEVPGVFACLHHGIVSVPDEIAELVGTQVLPDVLHRVQFRCVGR